MKENQILVCIKEPGEEPRIEPLFDNTLEAFQKAVGVKGDEFVSVKGKCVSMVLRMLAGERRE